MQSFKFLINNFLFFSVLCLMSFKLNRNHVAIWSVFAQGWTSTDFWKETCLYIFRTPVNRKWGGYPLRLPDFQKLENLEIWTITNILKMWVSQALYFLSSLGYPWFSYQCIVAFRIRLIKVKWCFQLPPS